MADPLNINSAMLDYDVSQEMVYYDQYYRLRGVRNYALFLTPKFSLDERFELPVNAIVHYLPENQTELGISPTHMFLRKAPTYILADHALEPATRLGNPMSAHVPANKLMMMYRNQSNKIRPLKNLETALSNPRIIIAMNYAIMNRMLRYKKVYQTRVFRFKNTLATFVQKANELAAASDRQQYLQITLPKVLLTKQQFVRGTNGLTRVTMNMFPDDESLLLLELWIWLSGFRDRSVLGGLTKDAVSKLNLVFTESGHWSMLNLGLLEKIRLDPNDPESKGDKKPQQLQIALLRYLTSVFTIRSLAAKTTIDVKTTDTASADEELAMDDDAVEDEMVAATIDGEEVEDLARMESAPIDDAFDTEGSDVELIAEDDDTQIKFIGGDESDDLIDPPTDHDDDLSDVVTQRSEALLHDGLLSNNEHLRYQRLSRSFETLPNPFGDGTLKDAITIDPEVMNNFKPQQFVDQATVSDKSMLKSTLVDWDRKYIKNVHHKHIAKMVMGIQQAGVAVTGYNVEKKTDANSQYEIHEVKVTPVGGAQSTIRFKLPVIKEDGTFKSAGINYRQRKQRTDVPIRKVSSTRVALTTYYAKVFVGRSERKVNDYSAWVHRTLVTMLPDLPHVKVVEHGRSFDRETKAPRMFTLMAKRYREIKVNDITFIFDLKVLKQRVPKEIFDQYLSVGEVPCGIKGNTFYVMGSNGILYEHGASTVLGTLEELIGLPMEKAPVEAVELTALGKTVPLAMLLGQKYGLTNLMRRLKADYRQVPRGGRLDLQTDEFVIRFADQSLVFSRQQPLVSLIMGSLSRYRKSLENYDLEEFDSDDVYAAVYELEGLGSRYLKEVELLYDVFIDPISKDILGKLKEPTTFGPLLMRAAELLTTDDHPDEMDGRYLRVRGYERMAGTVYSEIMRGVRQYRLKPVTARSAVDVNPNAIWMSIMKDPAISIVEESNPIQNLKEVENVTFGGTGGRSSRTMVKRTRAFNPHDVGLITEANVDNGEVGVTAFLSQNAKLGDLYGLPIEVSNGGKVDTSETAGMVSTSMLLCAGSDRDDSKRVTFVSIQMSHVVACEGYTTFPVRTGMENVIAQRTGDMFSHVAKGEGVIVDVAKHHVVIRYDDESLPEEHVEIGRRYGVSTGYTIPQDIVCDLPKGHRVNKGDVVVFNSGYFEREYMNPTQVTWKMGIPVTVAFVDTPDTFEDSSAISPRLAEAMRMQVTEVRELTVKFDQGIQNLVNIGQSVDSDSILCIIEDSITAGLDLFDERSIDTLSVMARNSPRAKYDGTVSKIDVLYNGDTEDMTESLREIVHDADKRRTKRVRDLKIDEARTGYAADLELDTIKIKIYIDSSEAAGDGDKGVLSHQLKTVVRRVLGANDRTESGRPLDVYFGYTSVANRIVGSAELIGTTATLARLRGIRAAKAYRAAQQKAKS